MDASNEIRRLHRVCRHKDAILRELMIACEQAIMLLDNQQPLTDKQRAEWQRAITAAEETAG